MNFEALIIFYSLGLFVGMLSFLEFGRRYGAFKRKQDPQGSTKGIGAIEGAVFGLLGLIIAFTFSGAASRFEDRRHLIADETNAIGTAYLRIDLLPLELQPAIRDMFRNYTDMRLETFRHVEDQEKTKTLYSKTQGIQDSIWNYAISNCQQPQANMDACKLLIPALNEMFDITTTRLVATKIHPPFVIYYLMGFLGLLGALLAGYGMAGSKSRNQLHMLVFSAVMSITVYVILDLEYPRLGLINLTDADQILVDLRGSMK